MSNLEELLPAFRKGVKIRQPNWNKNEYIYLSQNGIIYDERNKPFDFTNEELLADWELYQKPIDWDSIIKNKCLCYFWDNYAHIGYCTKQGTVKNLFVDSNDDVIFIDENDNKWKNCRPARRDEVTFYEDRKDE